MTVAELVALLSTFDPTLLVVHEQWSEHCILEADDITIHQLCVARPDGWVHNRRPNTPTQPYLVLP